ncbi:MAG: lipoyl domain-containing protein [Deltaproteobacteria bacterium]|nr:lipoyl domain-containing protein [Deltaproteobacteria bacterium]
MDYDIVIPPTADGALEVTVVSWIKNTGDHVSKGQDLAEATTEKITLYVTAPADGTLKEIIVSAGTKTKIGTVIGILAGE